MGKKVKKKTTAKGNAKRKKNAAKISSRKREAIGVFLIGLGLFIFFSIYTGSTGIIGNYVHRTLMGLFGIVNYVMPVIVMGLGILVIVSNYKMVNRSKIILSIMSFIFILCIIHILYFDHYSIDGILEFIESSYIKGMDDKGAGALLSPTIYVLYKLLGITGSYIFLAVVFIITLLVLTNLSFKKAVTYVSHRLERQNDRQSNRKIAPPVKSFSGAIVDIGDGNEGPDVRLLNSTSFEAGILEEEDRGEEASSREEIEILDTDIEIVELPKSEPYGDQGPKDRPSKEETSKEVKEEVGEVVENLSNVPKDYKTPPKSLLNIGKSNKKGMKNADKHIINNAKLLEETLKSFGVNAKVSQVTKGPVITRYEIQPAPGVKVSKIVNLADDISLNLAAPGIRIEAPIPGKAAIGIEVPNSNTTAVQLREVIESQEFKRHSSKVAFALGKDIAGRNIIADITKMPHLLIAGATGSGKSVCINTIIVSLLYRVSPEDVRLILIDPKVVELNNYNGIPHLLFPVVTDPKKAAGALNWIVQEMTDRYKSFADAGVRDLEHYNLAQEQLGEATLPQIVVIIDELSDLMMVAPNEVEDSICRLAQMARAAGIHLIIATQRPSVDVITGLIKANIPSRIAFAVSSSVDSRTILDMGGAEKLLGRGDMLYHPVGAHKPVRVQGCFISEKEVGSVVDYIKTQDIEPDYDEEAIEEISTSDRPLKSNDDVDELFDDAVGIVIDAGQASISMLQRRLRIGYARAARLIDEMEVRGFVSGFEGSKPRDVFITREKFEGE